MIVFDRKVFCVTIERIVVFVVPKDVKGKGQVPSLVDLPFVFNVEVVPMKLLSWMWIIR